MRLKRTIPRIWLGAAGILMGSIGIPLLICLSLVASGVPVAGFNTDKDNGSEEEGSNSERNAVKFLETPAGGFLKNLFEDLENRGDWISGGPLLTAAGLPRPLDCVKPSPTLSFSQGFKNEGVDAQLTVTAYPAGVGAAAFNNIVNDLNKCKGSGTRVGFKETGDTIGAQSKYVSASWASNNIQTVFFRRGDVIAFVVSGSDHAPEIVAKNLDAIIDEKLRKSCVNPFSTVEDSLRNPIFAGEDFEGLLEERVVSREAADKPVSKSDAPTVPIPAEDLNIEVVDVPNSDYPYVLWPELPLAVPYPVFPEAPEPQERIKIVNKRVEDPDGPGCGWSFLNTIQPTFDAEKEDRIFENREMAARSFLETDENRWKNDVQKYYDDYAEYLAGIEGYEEYRVKVSEVSAAWDSIHAAWERYTSDYEAWLDSETTRLTFIEDKAKAREDFESLVDACENFSKDSEKYEEFLAAKELFDSAWAAYDDDYENFLKDLEEWENTPVPVRGDKPVEPVEPSIKEPAEVEEPVEPNGDCPAVEPAILSENAPEALPEPVEPADPRPVNENP